MKKKRNYKSYFFTVLITMIISIAGTVFVLQNDFNSAPKEEKNSIISNTIVTEKLGHIECIFQN